MDNKQFKFTPLGDSPTVQNIWHFFYKCVGGIALICIAFFFWGNPSWHLYSVILFLVLSFLFYVIITQNRYTTQIIIDKTDNKFYLYYITVRGDEEITTIDLSSVKTNYKLDISRTGSAWILSIHDEYSSVKLMEGKSSSANTKNYFSKNQLDEMKRLVDPTV
jgi:hypothetical protein